jgi:hypothetical protein
MTADAQIARYIEARVRSVYRTLKPQEIEDQVGLHALLPFPEALRLLLLKEYSRLIPVFFNNIELSVISLKPVELLIPNKTHFAACATQQFAWFSTMAPDLPKGLVYQTSAGLKLLDGYHRTSQLDSLEHHPFILVTLK